jgi:PmbA protein
MPETRIDAMQIGDAAVSAALQAGADQAEAYVRLAAELDIDVRNGEIENLRRATTRGLGLRVMVGTRTALVHTTDLIGLPLLQLAARAVDIARALPEAPSPALLAARTAVEALPHPDPGLANEPIEARIEYLRETERAMLAVPGVTRTGGVSWGEADGETALVNSRGVQLYAPFCHIESGAEAIAERDGESYSGNRHASVPARRRLPSAPRMGRDAGERAVALLGARPLPSTKAPVIFTPYTGWAILAALVEPLRGDNVGRDRSYLGGRLGESIAAPGVTIRDNPLLLEGPARRAFDAEGTPCRDTTLVAAGRLTGYLTDLASAAQLGVAPGGNAVRGSYTSGIEVGTSNLYMEPGTFTPERILAETARGLLVTSLSGWWVGLSPARDEFSSAAMGIWIEDGKPAYAVRGVTIAGSLTAMLGAIDRIGNDIEFTGETCTPTFRVAEMTISGT